MYDIEKNKLIGQSILSLPNDKENRELSEYCSEYKNSEIAVFKAVIADPEYRGNGIMKKMLKIREEIAAENGRKIAISQIAADNPSSWINALRNGMKVTKVGLDPEDDAKVVYLKKGLKSQDVLKYNKENKYDLLLSGDVHKSANILFNKMVRLSEGGYVGIDWNRENHTLSWYKREEETVNNDRKQILCDNYSR
jgi:GNAT superfamily N-acetyltransferase